MPVSIEKVDNKNFRELVIPYDPIIVRVRVCGEENARYVADHILEMDLTPYAKELAEAVERSGQEFAREYDFRIEVVRRMVAALIAQRREEWTRKNANVYHDSI
jgi:hypothetical protein